MKDEVIGTFVKAMESDISDSEKLDIIEGLYEIMDIFNGVYGVLGRMEE